MKTIVLLLTLTATAGSAFAQCSDAGVCSFGTGQETVSHWLSVDAVSGKSTKDDDISFFTLRLSGDIQLLKDSRLSISVPFNRQSGPDGSTSGAGDILVAWNQRFTASDGPIIEGQIGARLPTGSVNKNGLSQRYQNGLGTTDLLIGANLTHGAWSAGAGMQIPFGRSDNRLNRLKRGQDVMLRAGYTQTFGAFVLKTEVIAIKRFGLSSVRDTTALSERFVDVPESDQGQINVVVAPSVPLSEHLLLHAAGAFPLLKRPVNIDGLTRAFTATLGLRVTF